MITVTWLIGLQGSRVLDSKGRYGPTNRAMSSEIAEILSPEAELALVHTPAKLRRALRIIFEFDARLARIVAATSEPMLGQMRLAWWRDTLGQDVADRPTGDAVLDGIGQHWRGREAALVKLIDGWEHLLAPPPLGEDDARAFAEGRRAALSAVFEGDGEAVGSAASRWALADLAAKVSLDEERAMLVRLGLEDARTLPRLPREARGLAVLGSLSKRALDRGGRPLMEGRGAAITAARAAILGR